MYLTVLTENKIHTVVIIFVENTFNDLIRKCLIVIC